MLQAGLGSGALAGKSVGIGVGDVVSGALAGKPVSGALASKLVGFGLFDEFSGAFVGLSVGEPLEWGHKWRGS